MSLLDRIIQALAGQDFPGRPGRRYPGAASGEGEMGTLERLLATLEASVSSFGICEVAAGDALIISGVEHPFFHYVLKGSGSLRPEGGEAIAFQQHTFLIVPARRKHALETQGHNGRRVPAMERSVAIVDHMLRISSSEDRPAEVVTTCGTIEATYGGSVGMFDFLDQPIAVQLSEGEPLRNAFESMLEELTSPRLGTRALTEALLKQCLVLLIRKVGPDPVDAARLFGLADGRLLRAIVAMVDNPAESFTLDRLAKIAGMSRSSFAARFQAAFWTTPIDLLKTIRLRHAARLLERTELPIAVIARSIGYRSRTYFSRAFRAEFGLDPRAFRARVRTAGEAGTEEES